MTTQMRHDGFIGEGTLYIRRHDRPDLGLIQIGNATELSVSMTSEVKERLSKMRENYGATLNTVILPKSGELKITLDDFSEENLAMVFMGALEKKQMRTQTVSDEIINVDLGRFLRLKHGYLKDSGISVKKASDDAPIAAEHYEIHHRLGMIKLKETAGVGKGDKIKVSYTTADWDAWIIQANTDTQIKCELILDGRNKVNGDDVRLDIPKATLSADGAFNFFSDDFNKIELKGRPEVAEGNIAPFTVTIKRAE